MNDSHARRDARNAPGALCALALLLCVIPATLPAQVTDTGNPLKLAPRPTGAAINVADLQTRLYIFADDSMMGRQAGREGNAKGTAYIARELQRLGIEPAGDNGTYFQALPSVIRKFTPNSTLTVDGRALRWLDDFIATPGQAAPRPIEQVQVVYGGSLGDTASLISAQQAAGKLVLVSPAAPGARGRGGPGGGGGRGGRGGLTPQQRYADAAAIATIDLHPLSMTARRLINDPPSTLTVPPADAPPPPAPQPGQANLRITPEAAARLLGRPLDGLAPGTTGGTVSARLEFVEIPAPDFARNVVGILRGSDPALAGQYVAIGAHSDHVGFNGNPVDHDSARAFASAELRLRIVNDDSLAALTPEQQAAIRVNVDSLRRLRPARRDSINNGADDDGSGSMAVLEIAEALALAPVKPRRSILFVWHTAEERGLLGSRYFVQNPTVPRDSIVAQVNIDMIGRGRAGDLPGGGEDYLAVVGSRRVSSELGDAVASVNQRQPRPLRLDYRFDEESTWPGYNNIYGRSDHANYARYNIPIAFFFTGLHQDYHRVTDEPQYIDYPHYSRITNYINALVQEVANRDRRPVVDKAVSE